MAKRTAVVAVFAVLTLPRLQAQLYVIAGSPTPKYNQNFAANLLQIGDGGEVTNTGALVPAKAGLEWITVSEDARRAVLLPRGRGQVVVIDLNAASVVKRCDERVYPLALIDQWLVRSTARGLALVQYLAGPDSGQSRLVGMLLDESIPCAESFVDFQAGDLLGLLAHGRSGVSDTGSSDGTVASVDADGQVITRLSGTSVVFPFTIPAEMRLGLHQPLARILIENSRFVAVGLFEKAGNYRILAFRKRDQTWHRVPVPDERVLLAGTASTPTPWVTGFGDFIALTEARTKSAEFPESAGRPEWRTTPSETGPDMRERFQDDGVIFPGRLHLYDIEHDRSHTIVTSQGDSEILLVQGNTIYYRVNNILYDAVLSEGQVGPSRVVAKSEALRDAHWAFIRQR